MMMANTRARSATRGKTIATLLSGAAESISGIATVAHDFGAVGGFGTWRGPIADLAIDSDSDIVVVSNYADGTISIIDPAGPSVRGVAVDGEPFSVVVVDDRAYISVTTEGFDAITVVDTVTAAVVASYPLAFSVTALAVSPDGKRVFAGRVSREGADIAVIDTTAERVGTIDIAVGPAITIDALRVDADGKRLYVATSDPRGGRLIQVDIETARVASTTALAAPVRDLAVAGATAYVLTSDRDRGGVVAVVDLATATVRDRLELGGAPTQMVLGPDATRLYVVDVDHVAVLCPLTNEITSSVAVDAQPSAIGLTADGARLYVADYTGEVTEFAVAATAPVRYALPGHRRELERATA